MFPYTLITPRPTCMVSVCNSSFLIHNNASSFDLQWRNSMYKTDKLCTDIRIHLYTHVSMSSTYVSFANVQVTPPNTTALWWSILVKVWAPNGGGLSPVVGWTAHASAGKVTEQKTCKFECTTAPCGRFHKYIFYIMVMFFWLCSVSWYGHVLHLMLCASHKVYMCACGGLILPP